MAGPTAHDRDDPWSDLLAEDHALLDRTSTAERVADALRQLIIDGRLRPGTRLSEHSAGKALAVSRNTLREAFRLLGHERLLVHEFHRGVYVRVLHADDVTDLYRTRRLLETGAIRRAAEAPAEAVAAVEAAVADAEQAAADERWLDVGSANMRFHQAIAALAGSPRTDEIMRQLTAELRLAFHAMSELRPFHEPYIAMNRDLARLLAAGEIDAAATALEEYLTTAERQLLDAFP
ncbi:GntR family transcriptional regulator [Prauserella rugosa]|uniref:DNA-binding GntR family transcriptional regulator n=1 Tax=Prauserella rugosa TaxID=43354 RepID=A0A660CLB5_9PSEU|nr:GntR family transcriptional regulator [Prauserella rugosa]TWH22449.1 DNA-binding GntR family transcriptional regulator [Prauserella rugosa]